MELQEHDIALLEAYLAGELAGADLQACEARLQAEPELAEALAMLREMGPATQLTATASLQQEMKAAKAAAIATGMAAYQPTINAPKGGNFLKGLLRFILTLAALAAAAWVIWKYVLHERWPGGDLAVEESSHTSETKTTTTKTIKRDTIWSTEQGGHIYDNTPASNQSSDTLMPQPSEERRKQP